MKATKKAPAAVKTTSKFKGIRERMDDAAAKPAPAKSEAPKAEVKAKVEKPKPIEVKGELVRLGKGDWSAKADGKVVLDHGTHNMAQRAIQALKAGHAAGSDAFKSFVTKFETWTAPVAKAPKEAPKATPAPAK